MTFRALPVMLLLCLFLIFFEKRTIRPIRLYPTRHFEDWIWHQNVCLQWVVQDLLLFIYLFFSSHRAAHLYTKKKTKTKKTPSRGKKRAGFRSNTSKANLLENPSSERERSDWPDSNPAMSSTSRKRPKPRARGPSSPFGLLREPPHSLFPSKDEFLKLVAMIAIAASVAAACNYVVAFFNLQPKPFCDSGEESQDPVSGDAFSLSLVLNVMYAVIIKSAQLYDIILIAYGTFT